MRSTIDAAGRVVVPKAMRRELGIDEAGEIEIELHDGVVEITRPRSELRLVEDEEGHLVLQAPPGTEPMTDGDVRQMIDESRRWPRTS